MLHLLDGYQSGELVPGDMLADLERAKVVLTNYRAFNLRDQDLEVQGPGVPLEN